MCQPVAAVFLAVGGKIFLSTALQPVDNRRLRHRRRPDSELSALSWIGTGSYTGVTFQPLSTRSWTVAPLDSGAALQSRLGLRATRRHRHCTVSRRPAGCVFLPNSSDRERALTFHQGRGTRNARRLCCGAVPYSSADCPAVPQGTPAAARYSRRSPTSDAWLPCQGAVILSKYSGRWLGMPTISESTGEIAAQRQAGCRRPGLDEAGIRPNPTRIRVKLAPFCGVGGLCCEPADSVPGRDGPRAPAGRVGPEWRQLSRFDAAPSCRVRYCALPHLLTARPPARRPCCLPALLPARRLPTGRPPDYCLPRSSWPLERGPCISPRSHPRPRPSPTEPHANCVVQRGEKRLANQRSTAGPGHLS